MAMRLFLVFSLLFLPLRADAIEPVDIKDLLLQGDELPSGWIPWVPSSVEGDGYPDVSSLCEDTRTKLSKSYAAEYRKRKIGPSVVEKIEVYSHDEAQRTFAELQSVSRRCSEWVVADEAGAQWPVRSSEIVLTEYGDESLAVETTKAGFGKPLQKQTVLVRIGNILLTIEHRHIGPGKIDKGVTEEFVSRAANKLRNH